MLAAGAASATTYYVGPSGSDENPGTEAEPFASIAAALAKEDVSEVRVAAGDYVTMAGMVDGSSTMKDGNLLGILRSPVKIVGAGADVVTLHCSKGAVAWSCGFLLDDAGSEVSGVKVVGSTSANKQIDVGTAFHVLAGTVKDCVIRDCGSQAMSSQVRLAGEDAVMQDCQIVNNVGPTNCKYCPGVTVINGLLLRCLISDNQGGDTSKANGLYLSEGEVRDCIIRNCTGANASACYGGGVYMLGGSLIGCTVTNNYNGSRYMSVNTLSAGGVYAALDAANVKEICISNCLIAANHNYVHMGVDVSGLVLDNRLAKVYDTVIENNRGAGGPQLYMKTDCLVSNCEIRDLDGNALVKQDAGTMTEDCVLNDGTASETRPAETFVSLTGSDTAPYDEPEKAATNLCDAIDAVFGAAGRPGLVRVAAGDYSGLATAQAGNGFSYAAVLEKAVRVVADEGPDQTSVTFNSSDDIGGGFYLGNDDAVLSGFTVSGQVATSAGTESMWPSVGSGLTMLRGTATNCVFTQCRTSMHVVPAVSMTDGTLTGCTIGPNSMKNGQFGRGAIGLYVGGGTVTNCVITENSIASDCNNPDLLYAGGLYLTGSGVVTDSIICSNRFVSSKQFQASPPVHAAGAVLMGGTLENCHIFANAYSETYVDNTYESAGVAVNNSAAVVRNCLIEGNRCGNTHAESGAGLTIRAGLVDHVTIAGNGPLDDVGTVGGLGVSGGTVKNTIVWGNAAGDASVAGGTVTHSCAPELTTGTGNLAVDPKFRRKGFAIGMHSPCAYAGEGGTYMGYAVPVPDGLTILVR